jgi:hypothetical protein
MADERERDRQRTTTGTGGPAGPADAALTSVAAHGLLNSVGVAKATVATLRLHWGSLDEATCLRLLERAEEQLTFLGESLSDLVRGIPGDTRQYLDGLRDGRETPSDDRPRER